MLEVGKVTVKSVHDWIPDPGSVVSWVPTPATLAKAKEAPANSTPASYMQAEHLRSWTDFASKGVEMSRFKIMVPKRSEERKENIEAGKGEAKGRKG